MKGVISKGILFDCFILIYGAFNYIIKNFLDISFFTVSILFGITMICLGIFLVIKYLVQPEDEYGYSKKYNLIIGLIYLITGPIMIYLKDFINDGYCYILGSIAIIHGLGKIFSNSHRGLVVKVLEMLDGALIIVFGGFVFNFFSISFFEIIEKYYILGFILVIVDMIILILSISLPRDDLENKNVQIQYSSHEDRIVYKKKHKKYQDEVIDLDKLFNKDKNTDE